MNPPTTWDNPVPGSRSVGHNHGRTRPRHALEGQDASHRQHGRDDERRPEVIQPIVLENSAEGGGDGGPAYAGRQETAKMAAVTTSGPMVVPTP